MSKRIKELIVGSEEGYCRICGNMAKLTEDHIPPKGCGNKHPVLISNFHGEKIISQNGAKFKTICSTCNNTKLGTYADNELSRVYNEFKSNFSKVIINPNESINISVNPKLIAQSICGHLLAIMFGDNVIKELKEKPVMTEYLEELKEFVLNDSPLMNVTIYYWFYPHSEIKINQYFALMPDCRKTKEIIMGSLFKFMPFGLWLVNTKTSSCSPNLEVLPHNLDNHIMKFNINKTLHKDKPEMPGNFGFTLLGDSVYNIKNKNG